MSRILYSPGKEKKTKRRPKRRVFFAVSCAFFFVIAAGAVYAVRRPQWQIRRVSVSGLHAIPEAALRENVARFLAGEYVWIVPHSSIIAASAAGIAEGIKKEFPAVKKISVRKHFPDSLEIAADERFFWGIFCNDLASSASSTCAMLDESGYAYAESPEPTGSLIIRVRSDGAGVSVGDFAIRADAMDVMRFLAQKLPSAAGVSVEDFELRRDAPRDIRAVMAGGYRIFARTDTDLENAMRVLKKVLNEEIGDRRSKLDYIDLRFGNKVFYKLR